MKVAKIDTWSTPVCTIGTLKIGDIDCCTLELPWRNNEQGISCIPAGKYTAKRYESPKHGPVILLQNVPGRSYIEIHAGNYTRQIQGCILVGSKFEHLDGDEILDVVNSKMTLNKILAEAGEDEFVIELSRS